MKNNRMIALSFLSLIIVNFLIIGFTLLLPLSEKGIIGEIAQEGASGTIIGTASSESIFEFYSNNRSDFAPLRIATFVGQNGGGYDENFAYLAAIPMSLYNENSVLKVSPLLYDNLDLAQENFLIDWKNYSQLFNSTP